MKMTGHEFMVQTRYENMKMPEQESSTSQPALELSYDKEKNCIPLPMPEEIPAITIDFMALVELRTSVRDYQPVPVSLLELSYLLWCTQGVKQILGDKATLRTVPSAGARHALETYLLLQNVEGVKPGLYRFLALEHKLLEVNLAETISKEIVTACLGQKCVAKSAVAFLWAAQVKRMTWRYGERGYRYLHLDAGHVCQNLYLAAPVIGCGVCAVAAFDDQAINAAIGLDGEEQFLLYAAALGKR